MRIRRQLRAVARVEVIHYLAREMKNEMRSMIQELLEMGMIGPRVAPEL